MRWIEIIGVSLSHTIEKNKVKDYFSNIRQTIATNVKDQLAAFVYWNATADNDWTIHLHRFSTTRTPEKTPLGTELAENLKAFGLVEHRIWIEDI